MKPQVPVGKGDGPLPSQELRALPTSLGNGRKQVGAAGSERLFTCGVRLSGISPPGIVQGWGLAGEEGAVPCRA